MFIIIKEASSDSPKKVDCDIRNIVGSSILKNVFKYT